MRGGIRERLGVRELNLRSSRRFAALANVALAFVNEVFIELDNSIDELVKDIDKLVVVVVDDDQLTDRLLGLGLDNVDVFAFARQSGRIGRPGFGWQSENSQFF